MQFFYVVLAVFGLVTVSWLLGVTLLLLRTLSSYNRLTDGVTKKTLSEILNGLLDEEKLTKAELVKVMAEMTRLHKRSLQFYQKLGVVRYNPFADTGGDQSFSLALLNGLDDGVLVTSLYSRTGVRWYIKTIKRGKGIEHGLSKEETEALKIAMKESQI